MSRYFQKRFPILVPVSLVLGAALALLQPGLWGRGWLGFSLIFLFCLLLLDLSFQWAGGKRTLGWIMAAAFLLRFAGGLTTYLGLPVFGYVQDEDQGQGFTYTDAHRRDAQAWDLAASNEPILNAFSQSYAYDQYGGLLAFSAFIYRYFSPDAHRPLLLVLLSGFMSALALPFLWKAASLQWGEGLAAAACWIFALYPESVLIGGSALREPYLWAFSAFVLWGGAAYLKGQGDPRGALAWIALGTAGMLLVSPGAALAVLLLMGGWAWFQIGRGRISWKAAAVFVLVFAAGLFLLASALNRHGSLGGGNPIGILDRFMREVASWGTHQLERSSGKVQALFNRMPEWLHLPFVTLYGVFQPVLPAALTEPTLPVWRVIQVLRGLGWYLMLPALILSFPAAFAIQDLRQRRLLLWVGLFIAGWTVFTSLRGGGDQWDNPRYRSILLLWQALLAAHAWAWWRRTRSPWGARVLLMELVFLVFFGQWYASRYFGLGGQIPFQWMIGLILGGWLLILLSAWRRDRQRSV